MDLKTIHFLNPVFLNLLFPVAVLFLFWAVRFWTRRRNISEYSRQRIVPVRERFVFGGKIFAWFCLLAAMALSVVAMARPSYVTSIEEKSPIDLIVILDGSASSRVSDATPDRWQRSIKWFRTLVQSMHWEGDRLALAVFARRASPFIRLTSDSNVVMFFIEHLDKESPISINDNTAWDTNIEEAIYWGLRLVEKDNKLYGDSGNAKAFILVSDGQAWSGEAQNAIAKAVSARIPVFVVGVGTDSGGFIPAPLSCNWEYDPETEQQINVCGPDNNYVSERSSIDRDSLQKIAAAGRGRYYEIGRKSDIDIASSVINLTRNSSANKRRNEVRKELYWELMCGSAFFLGLSVLFLFKQ